MSQGPALDHVVAALEAIGSTRRGSMWTCPAHDDQVPSLSVHQGTQGAVLLCQAGCATPDILDQLGLAQRDLFDHPRESGQERREVAIYDYVDERGDMLFQVVRYDPKGFSQRRPDGRGGWAWKLGNVKRVPYQLPVLLEAVRAVEVVYVAEGEKDVDTLLKAGVPAATTFPGGAGKWRDEYRVYFENAHVVVVADRDDVGRRHARTVAAALCEAVGEDGSVELVEPISGNDASDHLAAGHSPYEWGPFRDPEADADAPPDEPFLILASAVRMENATFLWEPYVPCGTVTVVAGVGGLGKSHGTLELAARVTRGQSKGDHHGKPGRVIIATAEDAFRQVVVPRLKAAGADLDRVSFVNIERGFTIPDDLPKLEEALRAEPDTVLVILDPLIAFIPLRLDAHKDQHARGALTPLAILAQRHDIGVVAVMHLNKAAEAGALFLRVSSSVGFLNAARSALLIAEDPDDENGRIVAHGKHNLSEPGESLRFRIEGTTVERDDGELIKTSRIVWLGASAHGVADLLKSDHRAGPRDSAERFLLDLLADGPVPAGKVRAEAEAADHAWRTVQRAKKTLDVKSSKASAGGGWVWELPPEDGHAPIGGEVAPFDQNEP